MLCISHLAEFLALVVRYERSQVLETRVYRLHPAPLVGVGNLPTHPFLVLHCGAHLRRPMAYHDRRESGRRWIHALLRSVCQASKKKKTKISNNIRNEVSRERHWSLKEEIEAITLITATSKNDNYTDNIRYFPEIVPLNIG